MKVVALGVHVVDVLVRPVQEIPEGQGVVTSADILTPGDQAGAILDWIAPVFEHLDYLLPDVVDTTGCGDAFSAGFLRGLSLGRGRRDAAVLGCAAAGLVATGPGSDHGEFDLAAADAFAAGAPTTTSTRSHAIP